MNITKMNNRVNFTKLLKERKLLTIVLPEFLEESLDILKHIKTFDEKFERIVIFSPQRAVSLFSKIVMKSKYDVLGFNQIGRIEKDNIILDFSTKLKIKGFTSSIVIGKNSNLKFVDFKKNRILENIIILFNIKSLKTTPFKELFNDITLENSFLSNGKKNIVFDISCWRWGAEKIIKKYSKEYNLYFVKIILGFGEKYKKFILQTGDILDLFNFCRASDFFITDKKETNLFLSKIGLKNYYFKELKKDGKEIFKKAI